MRPVGPVHSLDGQSQDTWTVARQEGRCHRPLVGGGVESFRAYRAYANQNVQVYLAGRSITRDTVLALSSGFMTYGDDAHPDYREIVASPSTAVLLPSFDHQMWVRETLRRQLTRPFSRSAEQEEEVIRTRFWVHWGLARIKFETARSVDAVVDDLVAHLLPNIGMEPTLPTVRASMSQRSAAHSQTLEAVRRRESPHGTTFWSEPVESRHCAAPAGSPLSLDRRRTS